MVDLLAGHGRRHSQDYYRRRAARCADWFVRHYLEWQGALREPFADGDVLLYDGRTLDVKCVTADLLRGVESTITGHAKHPPVHLAAIILAHGVEGEDEWFEHIGTIQPDRWYWGTPRYRDAKPCWLAQVKSMGPKIPRPRPNRPFQIVAFVPDELATPSETSLGDLPSVPPDETKEEHKKRLDRESQQRRTGRNRASRDQGIWFRDPRPSGQGRKRGKAL